MAVKVPFIRFSLNKILNITLNSSSTRLSCLTFSTQNDLPTTNSPQNDPPKRPKRPASVFIAYCQSLRQDLLRINPEASTTDLTKIASQRWKVLDETKKKELSELYHAKIVEYNKELEDYKSKLTNEQLLDILNDKLVKKLRSKSQGKNQNGKPKAVRTAFNYYVRDAIAARDPSIKMPELFKQNGKNWTSLPESEKQVYFQLEEEDKKRFAKEMAEWDTKLLENRYFTAETEIPKAVEETKPKKRLKKEKKIA